MIQQLLRELTELRGVSGCEDAVRAYILSKVGGHCKSCTVDRMGNVIVEVEGKSRATEKLLLSAHMDEVGFTVTHIEDDGTLCFTCVGGIMPAVSLARPVEVGDNALPGVIGVKPIHLMEKDEQEKYPKLDELRIDIGATDKESAEKLVSLGDVVTFYSPYREMGNGCFCVRAIDDRGGCALMLALILGEQLPYDCSFAFTVQEENGCIGSKGAAFAVQPDIALVVEGTTASDIPGAEGAKKVCCVGKGPVISHMDAGTVYDHRLFRRAAAIAEENGIKWQTKEMIAGGNDSRSYQKTAGGSRVMAVSIPVRYIHSATSVASWSDIEETLRLLRLLIGELAK